MTADLPPDDDSAWASFKSKWSIRPDTTYLNHGSFGPPPDVVRAARQAWMDRLDEQPMDFFVRQFEPAWLASRDRLGRFVGAASGNLIFVDNATAAMNIVADSFPLAAGDQVMLTDHEYGAVLRIWERACQRAGGRVAIAKLPERFAEVGETIDAIFAAATDRTRLMVVSHITSPTAVTLPVEQICRRARERGIAVAIDGPHAVAQLPLAIDSLGCDFYTASCHKWLSAPFGCGFLIVAPRWQSQVRPPVLSWGRIQPARVETWSDEFIWSGTRDPSACLSIPAAIDFLETVGLEAFRGRTHWLAQYARHKLVELTGREPMVPDSPEWYGAMAHAPLPPATGKVTGDNSKGASTAESLQRAIWRELRIEVPIVDFHGERYIRVSCHLYNDTADIDRLVAGLKRLLAAGN